MARAGVVGVLAAVAIGATGLSTGLAQTTLPGSVVTQLSQARLATAKYTFDLERAKADGYTIITPMIPNMGYHFLNPKIDVFDVTKPPILVYVRRGDAWQLVAIEWVRGQIAHQFVTDYLRRVAVTVEDETTRVESPGLDLVRLDPGARARVEFVPHAKGRFAFACTIEGHREAGMVGVLEVR